MSNYSIVPNAALTATADAIREKLGTQETIAFDNNTGFKSAVEEIVGGYTLEAMGEVNSPLLTGDIVYNGEELKPYAFAGNTGITSFTGNNVKNVKTDMAALVGNIGAQFNKCTSLESVYMPLVTDLYHADNIFQGCNALKIAGLDYKNMVRTGSSAFYSCSALENTTYTLPKVIGQIYGSFLTSNGNVTTFDIGLAQTKRINSDCIIRGSAFTNDTNLNKIIIRYTHDSNGTQTITKLDNINAFNGTAFASNGSGGTVYVPSDMVSSYESATNWSTILAYPNNAIEPIEGSAYENYLADGTPLSGNGVNLLYNAEHFDPSLSIFEDSNVYLKSDGPDGESYYYCSGPRYIDVKLPSLTSGNPYTISFEVYNTSATIVRVVYNTSESEIDLVNKVGNIVANEWTRFSYTFFANPYVTSVRIHLYSISPGASAGYQGAFRKFKLESGINATEYSIPPEIE